MPENRLEIVDENDVAISTAPRTEIHAKGLLHREASVIFVTPAGNIIFQRRSWKKDMFPGLLDATASGHVEIGDSYEFTAIKEVKEETGLDIDEADLILLSKERAKLTDAVTQTCNHRFAAIYGYVFSGSFSDLQIETDKADGFEAFNGRAIFEMSETEQLQFPLFGTDVGKKLYADLLRLVGVI